MARAAAGQVRKPPLDDSLRAELGEAFEFLARGADTIGQAQLRVALQALGRRTTVEELKVMSADNSSHQGSLWACQVLRVIVRPGLYDVRSHVAPIHRAGSMSKDQFIQTMHQQMWADDDDAELERCFREFAADPSLGLTFGDLERAAKLLGRDEAGDTLAEMMEEAYLAHAPAPRTGERVHVARTADGRPDVALNLDMFISTIKDGRST